MTLTVFYIKYECVCLFVSNVPSKSSRKRKQTRKQNTSTNVKLSVTKTTFCYFLKIPAGQSLCCCCLSCPWTHGRCSRYHGSHCRDSHFRVTQSHCHWTRCSSSPRLPPEVSGTGRSCDGCAMWPDAPGHCYRCRLMGGLARGHLGCNLPSGAVEPWSCTPQPPSAWSCRRWMLCTLELHPGPPEFGSEKAWSWSLLTSGKRAALDLLQVRY